MTRRPLTAEEKRQSRIKLTRELIRAKRLSGLLNNTKWFEIFEWISNSRIGFEIKLLSGTESRHCDFIRELENTSILVDNTGDFIEFLEIESLRFKSSKEAAEYLDSLRVEYVDEDDDLIIMGYRV